MFFTKQLEAICAAGDPRICPTSQQLWKEYSGSLWWIGIGCIKFCEWAAKNNLDKGINIGQTSHIVQTGTARIQVVGGMLDDYMAWVGNRKAYIRKLYNAISKFLASCHQILGGASSSCQPSILSGQEMAPWQMRPSENGHAHLGQVEPQQLGDDNRANCSGASTIDGPKKSMKGRQSGKSCTLESASRAIERGDGSAGSGQPGEESGGGTSAKSEDAMVIDQLRRGLATYPPPGEMQIRGRYQPAEVARNQLRKLVRL